MKVGIIGGGISGLSTAYYIKKLGLPVSEILLYEANSRFGGWINSKKLEFDGNSILFEKGPRTLRLATGEVKELNSIQLAAELNLGQNVELVSKSHPASRNRYIYYNGKINAVSQSLFKKQELLPKRLYSYLLKELLTSKRSSDIEDESIWCFISRRFGPDLADNLVDPLFKGICGGDIKNLSAATLVKAFYDLESHHGSIIKGAFSKKKPSEDELAFNDLVQLRKQFRGQSVWRVGSGMSELVNKIVERLGQDKSIKLNLNEQAKRISFQNDKIELSTNKSKENFDVVVSSIYSRYLADILPDEYLKLKNLLSKIECIDMVVINLYFKQSILPVQGFGYLVPTNQKSPIIGCIFDSVFNKPGQNSTNLTLMLGGAWYDEYIGNKTENQIYEMALNELKRQLNVQVNPDLYELNILKNCIPQYRVGHQRLLKEINDCLVEYKLDEKLYLTGNTYDGIGLNDSIFNARKLVHNTLSKHKLIKNKKE